MKAKLVEVNYDFGLTLASGFHGEIFLTPPGWLDGFYGASTLLALALIRW